MYDMYAFRGIKELAGAGPGRGADSGGRPGAGGFATRQGGASAGTGEGPQTSAPQHCPTAVLL